MTATGRIVVGIDGSRSSLDALRWAEQQARLTGSRLHVITCWHVPTTYGWATAGYPDMDFEADAHKVLDAAVAEVLGPDPRIPVTQAVVEGHPAPVLVQAADGAELLVVGSRGHGAFAGMLLGSVSEHCVHQAQCPVVVVRQGVDGEPRGAAAS